jgi:hypothetical protein
VSEATKAAAKEAEWVAEWVAAVVTMVRRGRQTIRGRRARREASPDLARGERAEARFADSFL